MYMRHNSSMIRYGKNSLCTTQNYHATTIVVVKTFFRSRDQDRDLDKMNSSALESRDHGLEITTLVPTTTSLEISSMEKLPMDKLHCYGELLLNPRR